MPNFTLRLPQFTLKGLNNIIVAAQTTVFDIFGNA